MDNENVKINGEVGEEQPKTTTQPEEKGERLFTQTEVNKIIAERLKREREKFDQAANDEAIQKSADLAARESRLTCKEFLMDNGYPISMLDCLDTSDVDNFKEKVVSIADALATAVHTQATPSYNAEQPVVDGLAAAFSRDTKHIPQQKYSGTDNYHYFDSRDHDPTI